MGFDPEALLELETRIREMREEAGDAGTEEATTAAAATAENSSIKAIRESEKAAQKRARDAEARVKELEAFKTETETTARVNSLTNAGLNPRQAEVFLKSYDDVTDENVQVFKSEVLGLREEAQEGTAPAQPFAPTGFISEHTEGQISVKDFNAMMKSANPVERAKADELARAGKVAFKTN